MSKKNPLHDLVEKLNERIYEHNWQHLVLSDLTYLEFTSVASSLWELSRFVTQKKLPTQHPEREKGQLLKELERMHFKLLEHGYSKESYEHIIPIINKVEKDGVMSAKQASLSVAKLIEDEFKHWESKPRPIVISFIKKALMEITKYKHHYLKDINELEEYYTKKTRHFLGDK